MNEEELYARALYFLSRREYGRTELSRKLLSYAEDSGVVEAVLSRLRTENLQSDERFSESLISTKAKKYGALRLAEELRRKGIDAKTAAEYLPDAADELQHALAVLQKKFRQPENTLEMKQKYYRFLAYRGFEGDMVSRAVKAWIRQEEME